MPTFENGGRIGLVWDRDMGGRQGPIRGYYPGSMGDNLEAFEPLLCSTGFDDPGHESGGQDIGKVGMRARMRMLWSIISGYDSVMLRQHESRIAALEARESFHKIARDAQK